MKISVKTVLKTFLGLLSVFLVFAVGVFVGNNRKNKIKGYTKLDSVISLINYYYVDSVDYKKMEDNAITKLLSTLDPHSVYLTAQQNKEATQGLVGGFSGIGVQFNTIKDTLIVVKVVEGGPSERAGIKPGDRIMKADSTNLLKLSTDSIMMALKGEDNTVVSLSIIRDGKRLTKKVVRGNVPVNTISSSYMITPEILFVKIAEWGINTYNEFIQAYSTHSDVTKGIIIDLRGNPGGVMDAALRLANEFLPDGKLLLRTKGVNFPKQDYYTTGNGILQNMPLTIVVDENSASASEIFSGIMQDYDRALILGRRTLGKGLVQEPFELKDKSVVRLTVAKYYIPSGRSIQKEYKKGDDSYLNDIFDRYYSGELSGKKYFHAKDSTKYKTESGRVVYAGGGIIPDVFMPIDSTGISSYYIDVNNIALPVKYSFNYIDTNRDKLKVFDTVDKMDDYLSKENLLSDFVAYADKEGIRPRQYLIEKCKDRLIKQIHNDIISFALGTSASIEYLNKTDEIIIKSKDYIESGRWNPQSIKDSVF